MTVLETISHNKIKWQNNAVDEIKNNLFLYDSDNCNIDSYREEKLVVIYGNSQVGKTSVILTLLGINDVSIKKVSDILRAGREKGESSTSTVILYKKSSCDKFGLTFKGRIGDDSNKTSFYSEEEFKDRLKEVREKIEKNPECSELLVISIPFCYFETENKDASNIVILDLPGDESNDKGEREHVQFLLKNYLEISSVIIIVVSAENIQNELPNLGSKEQGYYIDNNWKDLPSRYIVLTTHSYSQKTRKDYFNISTENRKESFFDFINKAIKKDFNGMKGFENSKISLFPLEVGDSYNGLLQDLHENDKIEVEKTRKKIMTNLVCSIQECQSNSVCTIISNLKENIDSYYREATVNLSEKETKLNNWITKDYSTEKKDIDDLITISEKNLRESKEFLKLIKNEKLISENIWDEYEKEIFSEIDKTEDNKDSFENHKILEIYENSRKQMIDKVITEYKEKIRKILQNNVTNIDESFFYKTYLDFIEKNDDIKKLKNFIYNQGTLFHFRNRPSPQIIKEKIKTSYSLSKLYDELKVQLNEKYNGQIKTVSEKTQKEINKYESLLKNYKKRLDKLEEKKENYRNKISLLNEEKGKLDNIRRHDQNVLNDYLKIAKLSIQTEKKQIYQKLNSNRMSGPQKIAELLALCLEEKQYTNLILTTGVNNE